MKKIMFNDRYGLTQAVFDKKKTMTRRIINDGKLDYHLYSKPSIVLVPVPECQKVDPDDKNTYFGIKEQETDSCYLDTIVSPYHINEVIAIAESYKTISNLLSPPYRRESDGYINTDIITSAGWTNKMFVCAELMPKQIKITNIHVGRLQEISDQDCIREGIEEYPFGWVFWDMKRKKSGGLQSFSSPRKAYSSLIDKISGRGTWELNPFVWAYEFELI